MDDDFELIVGQAILAARPPQNVAKVTNNEDEKHEEFKDQEMEDTSHAVLLPNPQQNESRVKNINDKEKEKKNIQELKKDTVQGLEFCPGSSEEKPALSDKETAEKVKSQKHMEAVQGFEYSEGQIEAETKLTDEEETAKVKGQEPKELKKDQTETIGATPEAKKVKVDSESKPGPQVTENKWEYDTFQGKVRGQEKKVELFVPETGEEEVTATRSQVIMKDEEVVETEENYLYYFKKPPQPSFSLVPTCLKDFKVPSMPWSKK